MKDIETESKDGWTILSRSSDQQISRWIKTVDILMIDNEKLISADDSAEKSGKKPQFPV